MVFSSAIFLFLFLPIVLIGHLLVGRRFRNSFLLLASLAFYAWGEGTYVSIMLLSILFNYFFGRLLDSRLFEELIGIRQKVLLGLMIAINLLPLLYFKYLIFLLDSLAGFLNLSGDLFPLEKEIHLPIGISFFTFQAISYLIDIYRKVNSAQRSILDVGLYISLFPQLIAGPIVRYATIADQLRHRVLSIELFSSGVTRFVQGLAKKMLIANPLGYVADLVFDLPASDLTLTTAWLGAVCYTLQIYFDFSGYSDMAIGLGRMLGFKFQENFNFPYISRSIREFWHRWHISLSTWFRDYVYLPLGGNRYGNFSTMRNLFTIFFLCGLWHGASWNFVIWGLLHGLFLTLERGAWGRLLRALPVAIQHGYVLLVVVLTFVFFRAETLSDSGAMLATMFDFRAGLEVFSLVAIELDLEFYLTLAFGLLLSTPVAPAIVRFAQDGIGCLRFRSRVLGVVGNAISPLVLAVLFSLSVLEIASGSYNPFIYFRF